MKISVQIVLFICLSSISLFAQVDDPVRMTSMDQLEARYQAQSDTLYVINFWATWCVPCIEELPYFEDLNKEMSTDNVKVLLISLDNPKQLESRLRPFVEKRALDAEVILLNEQSPHKYIDRVDERWSGAIPATLFIKNNSGVREFREQQFEKPELYSLVKTLNKKQ